MSELPLVSILCLSYNQSQYVIESLESIKSQSYKNFEILICDDCSKDDSVYIISNWIKDNPQLKVHFINHSENEGICKSLNELLNMSSGKYIQVLALDDLLNSDKLEKHVNILEKSDENQVMLFSDACLIDSQSKRYQNTFIPYHYKFLSLETGNFYERLLRENFIPAMSCLLKASALKKTGGWDENLTYEDYDMWLRLSKEYNFIYDNELSCSYRLHETNTHKKQNVLDKSIFTIYLKHKDQPIIKNKLLKIIDEAYLNNTLNEDHKEYLLNYGPKTLKEKLILRNAKKMTFDILLFLKKMYRRQ